jgi:prepilin-type N-terminal cleavage/methylation domain-containing protein
MPGKFSKRRTAFSLIELLVASAVMSLVFMAMVSLQSFVLNGKSQQWRRQQVFSQTAYSVSLISRTLMNASYIASPAPPIPPALVAKDNLIWGYCNTNPSDRTILAPGDTQNYGFFIYCVNAAGNKVYKYTGAASGPMLARPFTCGQTLEGKPGVVMADASSSSGLSIDLGFTIFSKTPTIVRIDYSVRSDKEEITGHADTQLQKSL